MTPPRRHDFAGLSLSLLSALDTADGVDETLELLDARAEDDALVVERVSSRWDRAWLELRRVGDALEVHTCVRGRGALTEVQLLGGRSAIPGAPLGRMLSGSRFPTLFSPNPEDGAAPFRPAAEGAVTGVVGEGEPGRARWLYTPAPLFWSLGSGLEAPSAKPTTPGPNPRPPLAARGDGSWIDLGVAAPLEQLRFAEVRWEAVAAGFSLRLDYDGRTHVDGEFRAPVLVLTPSGDPWAGLKRHRLDLAARGAAPAVARREQPAWWGEPIFCGWGAECWLEKRDGGLARDYSTQANYDVFLAQLGEHGVTPGTVVLDDKWQATYGRNEPDTGKWPDLRGWIAGQHEAGRHVLLWWKAWDPEGLAPELCIRNAAGVPVALDPNNPAARDALTRSVTEMLEGLGADGFKVDFTARTPSGRGLHGAEGAWGISLLHELLRVLYDAAKAAKPDALVITHTPHPAFVDVTDMIRLNDAIGGVDFVEQMEFRADVARAAVPELPIDTDDWRAPNKREWREYLERKREIGVPSLYYASHLDATGEELDDDDYAAIARVFARA
jgi:hypothetical protein